MKFFCFTKNRFGLICRILLGMIFGLICFNIMRESFQIERMGNLTWLRISNPMGTSSGCFEYVSYNDKVIYHGISSPGSGIEIRVIKQGYVILMIGADGDCFYDSQKHVGSNPQLDPNGMFNMYNYNVYQERFVSDKEFYRDIVSNFGKYEDMNCDPNFTASYNPLYVNFLTVAGGDRLSFRMTRNEFRMRLNYLARQVK